MTDLGDLFKLVALCIAFPLGMVWLFSKVQFGMGRLVGYERLRERYPAEGNPPDNTRTEPVMIGLIASGLSSVGSDERGLHIHFGTSVQPGTFIPWSDLTEGYSLGPCVIVRPTSGGPPIFISRRVHALRPTGAPRQD